jgi:hypothetical protein
MAKATSIRVNDYIPTEPNLLHPVVKRLLMVTLAAGSIVMLVGFVVATFIALF